jgi:hypothetical protein
MNDTSHTTHLPPSYHLLHKQPRLHGHVNALGNARDLSRLAPLILISSSQTVTVRPRSSPRLLPSQSTYYASNLKSHTPHKQDQRPQRPHCIRSRSFLRLFQINA